MYYSLKRSDKSVPNEDRWRYLNSRHIFEHVTNCNDFLSNGKHVLKLVAYLEDKVKTAKAAGNMTLMQKWNDKLNKMLRMPFHDHFDVGKVRKHFKAFEYPSAKGDSVEALCLNCYESNCHGCAKFKVALKTDSRANDGDSTSNPSTPANASEVTNSSDQKDASNNAQDVEMTDSEVKEDEQQHPPGAPGDAQETLTSEVDVVVNHPEPGQLPVPPPPPDDDECILPD